MATMRGLLADPKDPDLREMMASELALTDKLFKDQIQPLAAQVAAIKSQASHGHTESNSLKSRVESL